MAKKRKSSTLAAQKFRQTKFDPESSPYFTPIAFGILLFGMVILFGEFIFSDKIFYSGDMMRAGIFFRFFLVKKTKS